MNRALKTVLAVSLVCCFAAAAEPKLQLKDLPPAVQSTVQKEARGAEIKKIAKETEKGVTQYEVETIVNHKHRDFNVDTKGHLIVVEEEVPLSSIPAPAKTTIQRKAAGSKLGMVEVVKEGEKIVYEAAYTDKRGKKQEIMVNADGTEAKN